MQTELRNGVQPIGAPWYRDLLKERENVRLRGVLSGWCAVFPRQQQEGHARQRRCLAVCRLTSVSLETKATMYRRE